MEGYTTLLVGIVAGFGLSYTAKWCQGLYQKFLDFEKARDEMCQKKFADMTAQLDAIQKRFDDRAACVLEMISASSVGDKGTYKTESSLTNDNVEYWKEKIDAMNAEVAERYKTLLDDIANRKQDVVEKPSEVCIDTNPIYLAQNNRQIVLQ